MRNAKVTAEILNIPEELVKSIWELLKSINSKHFQDYEKYQENALNAFKLWAEALAQYKTMTHNVHLLISHGVLYLK